MSGISPVAAAETALAIEALSRASRMSPAMVKEAAQQEQAMADMLSAAAEAGAQQAALPPGQGLTLDRTV